jgi:DNA-binding response OmpR family regulator
MTPQEDIVWEALQTRQVVTKDDLLADLYHGRPEVGLKILDVLVCRVRRKTGANIVSIWGRGWQLK